MRDNLDNPADGIAAVQGRRRSAYDFETLDRCARHERQVLRRCAAKDRIIQAHAVNEVQHGRPLETADDGGALPRRRLLQEDSRTRGQRVTRKLVQSD